MTLEATTPNDLLAHAEWLRALALRLARDEASADDLVQDTWAAALTCAPARDELRAWLARAVGRLARHRRRGELRRRWRERVAAERRPDRSDALVQRAFEAQRELARRVAELPEPYRTLVLRRYYEGDSAAEIARRTGVPAATVRSQLARARAILRRRWGARRPDEGRSGLAGLVLIAGVSPDVILRGGALMKSTHTALVAAACAVAVLGVWGSGILSEPVRPAAGADHDPGPIARVAPEERGLAENELAADAGESARRRVAPVERDSSPAVGDAATPPTRLIARLVDERGAPIAGARMDAPEWAGYGVGVSDDAGQLAFITERDRVQYWEGQPVARLFRITSEGHATHLLRAALVRDEDTDLGEIVLAPGGVVVGRVLDEAGIPIVGARVLATDAALGRAPDEARRAGPGERDGRIEVESGAEGTYRLAGVAVGPGRVWARVEGRPWGFTPTLDVRVGIETRALDLVLAPTDPSRSVTGVVLDPSGAPVEGALVTTSGHGEGIIRNERAVADAAGRFRVAALDEGPQQLEAFHPEGAFGSAFVPRVLPGAADLELRLTELAWVELSLVDDRDGEPVDEPWVHVEPVGSLTMAHGIPQSEQVPLGPGRLRVPLPAREFEIAASAAGYDHRSVGPFAPGSMPAAFEIRLERKPVVSGRVVADGEPVAGARVQTMREMGAQFSISTQGFRTRLFDGGAYATETDEDGRFEHPVSTSMPSGAHVVRVSKEGFAAAERVIEVAEDVSTEVELELTSGGVIEGRVLVAAGSDPRGAIVAASNGDGVVLTARADTEGLYRLEHLAPGPWQVRYREQDEQFFMTHSAEPPEGPYEGDCTVLEGRTTHYDVDARDHVVSVAGRLTIDGRPATGWTARLEERQTLGLDQAGDSVVLDDAGDFAVVREGAATHLILETPETSASFARLTRALEPDAGASNASLDLVTGRLTGAAEPGALVRLNVIPTPGWSYRAQLDADAEGRFDLRVPAGRVKLSIQQMEPGKFTRWVEAAQVDLEPGAETSVELE